MDDNLNNRIYCAKQGTKYPGDRADINENEKSALYALLGTRCRANTKAKLARRLELPLSLWPTYGIYNRVGFFNNGAEYCAGQDYTSEIALVRKLIIEG